MQLRPPRTIDGARAIVVVVRVVVWHLWHMFARRIELQFYTKENGVTLFYERELSLQLDGRASKCMRVCSPVVIQQQFDNKMVYGMFSNPKEKRR